MRKKILTIVNDEILKDPRALRFRRVLETQYDVFTICSSYFGGRKEESIIILYKNQKLGIISLFIYWIKVIKLVRGIKPDAILAHDYYMAFPGLLSSLIYKIPLIYDAYEFYAPQRGVKMTMRDYFFFLLEKRAIKKSILVFSANLERSRLMKHAYKLKKRPIPVLNIPDFKTSGKREGDYNPSFITVVYEGYIDFSRYVDSLVNAFEYLPENYNLLIIGGGHDEDRLKELISGKNYRNRIVYKGRVDTKDVIPCLQKCDIGFVGYPFTDLNNRFCSPNKIYEYPSAGIPFVSTKQSTIWHITRDYHICEYYDPVKEGPRGIAEAIIKIANNYTWYSERLSVFLKDNSWDIEAKRLLLAVNSLI